MHLVLMCDVFDIYMHEGCVFTCAYTGFLVCSETERSRQLRLEGVYLSLIKCERN